MNPSEPSICLGIRETYKLSSVVSSFSLIRPLSPSLVVEESVDQGSQVLASVTLLGAFCSLSLCLLGNPDSGSRLLLTVWF